MVQRVIEGKIFDTEKATAVASIGYQVGDYYRWTERIILSLTGKGAWFVFNSYNHEISPLSPEEAFEWLCKYDKGSALRKHFPDRVEDA